MLGNIVSLLVATQNISLRTENFELVSISKCFVQYDSIVAYCASFDSIHYGIDIVSSYSLYLICIFVKTVICRDWGSNTFYLKFILCGIIKGLQTL